MPLADLLTVQKEALREIEVTPELLKEHMDDYRHIIAYWRMYPDRLVDYYCSLNPENTFHFYWYQRVS